MFRGLGAGGLDFSLYLVVFLLHGKTTRSITGWTGEPAGTPRARAMVQMMPGSVVAALVDHAAFWRDLRDGPQVMSTGGPVCRSSDPPCQLRGGGGGGGGFTRDSTVVVRIWLCSFSSVSEPLVPIFFVEKSVRV